MNIADFCKGCDGECYGAYPECESCPYELRDMDNAVLEKFNNLGLTNYVESDKREEILMMAENNKTDIFSMPYAKWLESVLKDITKYQVKGISFNAVTDDGDIYTNYYNLSMGDKLLVSGIIQQDAMLDNLAANGVIEYDDDEENEDDEYGEEKE